MANGQQYIVTGPLVIAKGADGKVRYLYQDAVVPDGIPAEEVERLVETGLVRALDEPVPAAPAKNVDPAADSTRPAAGAPKAEWVEWAVAHAGLSREAAEALTKDKLAALPG